MNEVSDRLHRATMLALIDIRTKRRSSEKERKREYRQSLTWLRVVTRGNLLSRTHLQLKLGDWQ